MRLSVQLKKRPPCLSDELRKYSSKYFVVAATAIEVQRSTKSEYGLYPLCPERLCRMSLLVQLWPVDET